MKRIEIIENSVGKVQMQNMRLDKEIAELQTNIDDKRSTSQYLLHETELIARNERYYQSLDISTVISWLFEYIFSYLSDVQNGNHIGAIEIGETNPAKAHRIEWIERNIGPYEATNIPNTWCINKTSYELILLGLFHYRLMENGP